MKTILCVIAVGATGAFWVIEWTSTAALRTQLDLLRDTTAELRKERRERSRLVALQPTPDELARLERAAADRARRQEELDGSKRAAPTAAPRSLSIGEWLPHTEWSDCGRRTPTTTVQTM